MNFTSKEKSAIISTLSAIMNADGSVDAREQHFLDEIFRKFAITVEEYQASAHMSKAECKQIYNEMTEDKKERTQKCLLDMVGADDKVDLRELSVVRSLFV